MSKRKFTPFTVLHVCLGNICRSPMAERLLTAQLQNALGDKADQLLRSVSAGTGDWHVGESMHRSSARQVRLRGGDSEGFTAQRLHASTIAEADLILTASTEHADAVRRLALEAADRTFLLREFGRLVSKLDTSALPHFVPELDAVAQRAMALVAAANTLRDSGEPTPDDELADPWGYGEEAFIAIADEIEAALRPFVAALTGQPS